MDQSTCWTYCTSCQSETKHTICATKTINGAFDEYMEMYQIVECKGCENLSFRIETHDYLMVTEEDETPITVLSYPEYLKGHTYLKGYHLLPEKIKDIYLQTILAFRGRSYLLTGAGFRAVIEAICIEEKIKGHNLEQKINNLTKNRLITDKEAERLHSIRFLGNDSIHEMEIPKEHKLFIVLDIIENLLKNLYIIDRQAKSVLDTIIKDYSDFETLLWKCAEKQNQDEEKTLKEIFGKHIRRLNIDFVLAEKAVIEGINKGVITFLRLGAFKKATLDDSPRQHYFFTGQEYDDLPF